MLMWWRTWQDDQRRLWAERQITGDPADGKRNHAADKQYRWATDGMHLPAISPLEFTDEHGQPRWIAAGHTRENHNDRLFRTGATPTPTSPTATTNTTTPPTPTSPPHNDLPF